MKTHKIKLTNKQKEFLNKKFPNNPGNKNTELRAEEIVKIFLRKKYLGCNFANGTNGSDLRVVTKSKTFEIEVKGTKQTDIAWTSLKINGKPSYERLEGDLPLYRVTGVFSDEPKIVILINSKDFDMVQEDRWRVRAKRDSNKK